MKKIMNYALIMILLITAVLSVDFTKEEVSAAANADTVIHFITLNDNTDAILLESHDSAGNPLFGMVDSGEDTDGEPNPTNGSTPSGRGYEDQVLATMHDYKVTADNFIFYIGTHPHSDHIGSGDTIIDEFKPERVYLQPYDDSYVSNKNNLWDNATVYQDVLDAADRVGATVIQLFDTAAPVNPVTMNITSNITWVIPAPTPTPVPSPTVSPTASPMPSPTPDVENPDGEVPGEDNPGEDVPAEDDSVAEISAGDNTTADTPAKPDAVTVHLMDGTKEVASAVATEADGWTYTFENVPKYTVDAFGVSHDAVYTVKSDDLTALGYTVSTDPATYAITYTYTTPSGKSVSTAHMETQSAASEDISINTIPDEELQAEAQSIVGTTDDLPQAAPDAASVPDPTSPEDALNPETLPSNAELFSLHKTAVSVASSEPLRYTANPTFQLGTATIDILNHSTTYMTYPENDANNFSLAVKVTAASGKTALLMGDVNNYENTGDPLDSGYDETKLADEIGHVDVLKFGHHGYYGSNMEANLKKFSPTYGILTGDFPHIPTVVTTAFDSTVMDGTKFYATSSYSKERLGSSGLDAINIDLDTMTTNIPSERSVWGVSYNGGAARYDNGSLTRYTKTTFVTDNETGKLYCFGANTTRSYAGGWNQIDGSWYYMYQDCSVSTGNTAGNGWFSSGGKWYYLNPSDNGKMAVGWTQIGSDSYFFTTDGVMLSNQWIDGKYVNAQGAWVKGLVQPKWMRNSTGWWYRNSDNSYPKHQWMLIKNVWYYFDSDGYLQTGWFNVGGKRYYSTENGMLTGWFHYNNQWFMLDKTDGSMQTGWYLDGSTWYYLNSSGVMLTGWQKVGSSWYYMNGSGAMLTGWVATGGHWYYLQASGAMKTGWVNPKGTWYYLNSSGAMLTGWQRIGNAWYYMDGSGAMKTGWLATGGRWYYLQASGAMKTGWINLSGTWYYLNNSGAMLTGWQRIGNTWYYMNGSGAMLTGWVTTGGHRYYLQASGAMKTGWIQLDGTWYYLNSSGAMVTNWQKISGRWYYFYGDGTMAANTNIGTYYVDSSGAWVA